MDEINNALKRLKMPGMAHYWTTMQETRQTESLSLRDGLQLLIQAELDCIFRPIPVQYSGCMRAPCKA